MTNGRLDQRSLHYVSEAGTRLGSKAHGLVQVIAGIWIRGDHLGYVLFFG
jgi:hypothetical protein